MNSHYQLSCPDTGKPIEYYCHPHHRDNNPNKSQWIICCSEEFESFELSYAKGWILNNNAWGLYYLKQNIDYLGITKLGDRKLFLAKFKKDPNQELWHGYPADYQNNTQDIPDNNILQMWKANKILPKAKISKILQGKPCSI